MLIYDMLNGELSIILLIYGHMRSLDLLLLYSVDMVWSHKTNSYVMHLSIVSPTTPVQGRVGIIRTIELISYGLKSHPYNGEFDLYIFSYTVDFYI